MCHRKETQVWTLCRWTNEAGKMPFSGQYHLNQAPRNWKLNSLRWHLLNCVYAFDTAHWDSSRMPPSVNSLIMTIITKLLCHITLLLWKKLFIARQSWNTHTHEVLKKTPSMQSQMLVLKCLYCICCAPCPPLQPSTSTHPTLFVDEVPERVWTGYYILGCFDLHAWW